MRRLMTFLTGIVFATILTGQNLTENQFAGPFLSGYGHTISGEIIQYHSFHPYANKSLLTRNTTGEMSISWATDAVPEDFAGSEAYFLWIGGFSTGTSDADRYYDVKINGEYILTIVTHPGCDTSNWVIKGKKGFILSYQHVWIDHVRDAFGYFCLQAPATALTKGKPLQITVTGRKQDDGDWFMTFTHSLHETADCRPLPCILKNEGQAMQVIRVALDYPQREGNAVIRYGTGNQISTPLHLGINIVDVPVPLVTKDTSLRMAVSINNHEKVFQDVLLRPVRQKDIYLLHHSHNDIGYTDLQTNILQLQIRNIREAMRLIKQTKKFPEEARFKWNVEIMWAVEEFLKICSTEEREEFIQDVQEGSIGLQALYTNALTGICRPEELMRLTEYATSLSKKYNIPLASAMVSDIPGFSWNIVPALAQAGVRYFSSGPNNSDRIGHSTEAWGDRPFWWVSPSGEEKILFWMAGKGYSMFHYTTHISTNPEFSQKLFNYLDDLNNQCYPYNMVQIRYTVYSDNGPTDSTLSGFVRSWNERYASPRLIISTSEAMFREFEAKWGTVLPSASGDFTPYWEDGALSSAAELGLVRRSSERLTQAENLAAILEKKTAHDKFFEAWKNVHLFDEHTWGAYNSISEPENIGVIQQWAIKQGFALQADEQSHLIMDSILDDQDNTDLLEVINTLSWPRSDVVRWKIPSAKDSYIITELDGTPVPTQILSSGELAFLASDIPPLGSRKYRLNQQKTRTTSPKQVNPTELSNDYLSLKVSPDNGSIISLADKTCKLEFAGTAEAGGLNSWTYQQGLYPPESFFHSPCTIARAEDGPVLSTLRITSATEGNDSLTREVTLYKSLRRIDIKNTIDKKAVFTKEAFYFGFPVNLQKTVHRFDLGWGTVIPDIDQLPGSCRDFFSVQRWADISNLEVGLTVTVNEAPLIEAGKISNEQTHNSGPGGWLDKADNSPVIWSFVLNNYWHTNYKATQEGPIVLNYSLHPHGPFLQQEAERAGLEAGFPLVVRRSNAGKSLSPLFTLSSQEVFVSSFTLSEDKKAMMIRLRNISGRPVDFEILWGRFHPAAVYTSSLREEQGSRISPAMHLTKNGIITLRCEWQ
ncbi:MAG: glycoside hydrolase family 38 C-terminal domain-containing protein [Bacteroidales bacterium]